MIPFTLLNHDGTKQVTMVLEFWVLGCHAQHNILLTQPTLLQLQAISSTLHRILKFNTSDGSATVVATMPGKECSAQQETKQETESCRNESFQKEENRQGSPATTQMLVNESRKMHRNVFRWFTTSLSLKETNVDLKMVQTEHEEKIANRGNSYPQTRASVWP